MIMIRWFKAFLSKHKGATALCLLLHLAANLFSLALPLLLAYSSSLLFDYQSVRIRLLAGVGLPLMDSFEASMVVIGVALLLKGALDYAKQVKRGALGEQVQYALRRKLFQHHLKMQVQTYETRGVGRYLLRFSGDFGSIQQFLTRGIFQFFGDATLVMFSLMLVWSLSPLVGGGITLFLAGLAWLILRITRRVGLLEEERRDRKSGMLSFINHRLQHVPTIRLLNRETFEMKRLEGRARKIRDIGLRYHRWASVSDALIPVAIYGQVAGVLLLFSGWKGGAPMEAFAIALLLLNLRNPLGRMFDTVLIWKKGAMSIRNVMHALEDEQETDREKPAYQPSVGRLSLEGIRLCRGGRIIFDELSFELERGEMGLVAGPSGSGKSSLVRLLGGLLAPDEGEILFDGQSMSQMRLATLRRRLTFVSDSFPLYGRTVGEALGINSRNQDRAMEMWEAWVKRFPTLKHLSWEGTLTGQLAAGQVRLLQYFQAFLTKERFLLIDEPFAGLDGESARQIAELLRSLYGEHSILLLTAHPDQIREYGLTPDWEVVLGTGEMGLVG